MILKRVQRSPLSFSHSHLRAPNYEPLVVIVFISYYFVFAPSGNNRLDDPQGSSFLPYLDGFTAEISP